MPTYVYLCKEPKCAENFDKDKPLEDQLEDLELFAFETWYSDFNELSKREWCPCPKCGKKAKKVPALTARMTFNWSKWNV